MEVGEMEVGEVVPNLSTIIVQTKNSTSLQVQSVHIWCFYTHHLDVIT